MSFQYIAIEGPIGVGKTSLAERLAARLDATAALEETDNPFLGDFYNGRPGAALQAQLFFLLNRHRQQLALRQGDGEAALRALDTHTTDDRILLAERSAARILALCSVGRVAEARRAAARFRRDHPESVQRDAIARSCAN